MKHVGYLGRKAVLHHGQNVGDRARNEICVQAALEQDAALHPHPVGGRFYMGKPRYSDLMNLVAPRTVGPGIRGNEQDIEV